MDSVLKEKIAAVKLKANRKAEKKVGKLKKSQSKKLQLQRKLGFWMGVGSTCVVLCAAATVAFPVADYVKGTISMRRKAYEQAAESFGACGDFLNSKSCRQEALYNYGGECYAEERYQEAHDAFAECGEYKDSVSRVESIEREGLV